MGYVLENEYLTVVLNSFGGSLTSIQNKEGLEYLWQGDATYWSGQAPVLFPICGSLRDNQASTSKGELLRMPRHGLVRKLEFTCEKHTDSEIIFSIEADEELLRNYPYNFKLFIHYQLIRNHMIVQYIISNRSDRKMPFFIGGHPAFNCPLEKGLQFEDYQVIFEKRESNYLPDNQLDSGLVDRINKRYIKFDGQNLPMNHTLFERDALIFANSISKAVQLSSTKGKHKIELLFEDFPNLLVWSTGNGAPFVALEPMVGLSTYTDEDDVFEHKENLQMLSPFNLGFYTYTMIFH